jgi:hypothetical protein
LSHLCYNDKNIQAAQRNSELQKGIWTYSYKGSVPRNRVTVAWDGFIARWNTC